MTAEDEQRPRPRGSDIRKLMGKAAVLGISAASSQTLHGGTRVFLALRTKRSNLFCVGSWTKGSGTERGKKSG